MTDAHLTVVAVVIDVGATAGLAVTHFRKPQLRHHTSVILGAITPIVLFYAYVSLAITLGRRDSGTLWAFAAMWGMTFWGFVASFLFGLGISLTPIPLNLYARYAFGLATVGAVCIVAAVQEFR